MKQTKPAPRAKRTPRAGRRAPVPAKTDPALPPALTVVGLGSSAGGLEALTEFFGAVTVDSGLSYVVIQHLAPNRDSMLAEILGRATALPVHEVRTAVKVQRNHVYVIRPGRTLTLRRGLLILGKPLAQSSPRHPIDEFFRSLAEEAAERAIGVVLSGMGSDGTIGARVIKAAGGLCIAQDPTGSQYTSMPQSVIDAGVADFVLPPRKIPAALINYSTHPYVKGRDPSRLSQAEQKAFEGILLLIRERSQRDFSVYRKPTMIRRIYRRMGLNQIATMADYLQSLRRSGPEVGRLTDDLLIHVTEFFRDPPVWRSLRAKVIEPLVAKHPAGAGLRVWVTACSTGEEAYTLGMVLLEAAEAAGKTFDLKIFATDASESAVNRARAGIFPAGIENEISPRRLERFFEPYGVSYRVRKELREIVVFAPHDLLADPPFSRLDLCTCRNFLIYLEPAVQLRLLTLLQFSLDEGGFLLLGNSESLGEAESLFGAIDRKHRIFRRLGRPRQAKSELSPSAEARPAAGEGTGAPAGTQTEGDVVVACKTLLAELAPAAVAIDPTQRIVYFHGNTSRYLVQPKGASTRELLAFIRKPLRAAVRNAVVRALAQKHPRAVHESGPASGPGRLPVDITVTPLGRRAGPAHYLISFLEHPAGPILIADGKGGTVRHRLLVRALQQAREELRSTMGELQVNNEEMRAANEESTSVNEELQSANEELETSKEELQALNDELSSVNAQLEARMEELQNNTRDMGSLLSSTDIAVVFLDRQLRIRRHTPAVKDLVEIIDADVGRPLDHLALKFTDAALQPDLDEVLNGSPVREAEIVSASGRTYVRRVLPYRKEGTAVEGVVVTFVDITARKVAELEARRTEKTHRLILEGIKEYGIFMFDLEGRFATWTAGAERILGYTEREVLGHELSLLHTEEDRAAGTARRDFDEAAAGRDVFIERWHVRKDGGKFWGTGILSPLDDDDGRPYGFVKVLRDNTDRKLAEEALERAMRNAEAANASKDHFLANVSHELRTPLSAVMLWAKLLLDQKEADPAILREGLEAIARSANEQQVLIEDLMDTAKIVAGKLRLEPKRFDLNRLLRHLLPPIRTLAAEKSLVIEETLAPDVGTVTGDPRRLQQVISNLLNNAIKFTPAGGRIKVQTLRRGEDVEIRVSDNGKGIPPDFLGRIFDRFVQLDQGTTPTASGMGLGLAIVKQLAELHGGTIHAQSPGRDQGAEFILKLPLPREEDLAEEVNLAEPKLSLRGRRVLLVEDSPETRQALEMVLADAEAEVVAVSSAPAALEEFSRARPDLILSDIGLDGMTGHQLLAEIRKRERELNLPVVPAIALTAYADEKNARKAFESGFQDCTTKPIEPQVLIRKLANLGAGN